MNYEEQLLQCALRIERYVMHFSDDGKTCCQRCCMAHATPAAENEETDTDSAKPIPEVFYNQVAAAGFLERSEKQVYRYRVKGMLPFSFDDQGCIRYAESDLEVLFEELHGFPKGGFSR